MAELNLYTFEWYGENADWVRDQGFEKEQSEAYDNLSQDLRGLGSALLSDNPQPGDLKRGLQALYITYYACHSVSSRVLDSDTVEEWQATLAQTLQFNADSYVKDLVKDRMTTDITTERLVGEGIIDQNVVGLMDRLVYQFLQGLRNDIFPYNADLFRAKNIKLDLANITEAYQQLLIRLVKVNDVDTRLDGTELLDILTEAFTYTNAKLLLSIVTNGQFQHEPSTIEHASSTLNSNRIPMIAKKLKMLADILIVVEEDEED